MKNIKSAPNVVKINSIYRKILGPTVQVSSLVILSRNTGIFTIIEKGNDTKKYFILFNFYHCVLILNCNKNKNNFIIIDSLSNKSGMYNNIKQFCNYLKINKNAVKYENYFSFQECNSNLCWVKYLFLLKLIMFKKINTVSAIRLLNGKLFLLFLYKNKLN